MTLRVLAYHAGARTEGDFRRKSSIFLSTRFDTGNSLAGSEADEVDLAEVHYCFTGAEILAQEVLGLVEDGQGGPATEAGRTRLGGYIPIDLSGGLKSKGYSISATGNAQIVDLTEHIHGDSGDQQVEGAERTLAHDVGWIIATADYIPLEDLLDDDRLAHESWVQALRNGTLLDLRCAECDYVSATPKAACLQHGSRSISVVELPDIGTAYTKTTIEITPEDHNSGVPDSYHPGRGGPSLGSLTGVASISATRSD